jgi:hypothetical protein
MTSALYGKTGAYAQFIDGWAYEDERTRVTAGELGFNPVAPPKRSRVYPWEYDTELYKKWNEIERFFYGSRDLEGFAPAMSGLTVCLPLLSIRLVFISLSLL